MDNSHPLAAGVALEGVIWAGAAITNSPGEIPVILAGNVPLLSVREDLAGGRHLNLNINPGYSTVQNTPDWPILFWNILSWRIAEMPGLKESNARLGTEVTLRTDWRSRGDYAAGWSTNSLPKDWRRAGAGNACTRNLFSDSRRDHQSIFRKRTRRGQIQPVCLRQRSMGQVELEDTQRRLEETSAVWIFLDCSRWHCWRGTFIWWRWRKETK